MCIARQTDGTSRITWKTKPVPERLEPTKPFSFTWVAGLGYISQASGKFTLYLEDKPILELDVVHKNTTWQSADGQVILKYEVKSADGEDSSGLMTLSVPGKMLKPGERFQLQVIGSARNSRRWFGLYEVDNE